MCLSYEHLYLIMNIRLLNILSHTWTSNQPFWSLPAHEDFVLKANSDWNCQFVNTFQNGNKESHILPASVKTACVMDRALDVWHRLAPERSCCWPVIVHSAYWLYTRKSGHLSQVHQSYPGFHFCLWQLSQHFFTSFTAWPSRRAVMLCPHRIYILQLDDTKHYCYGNTYTQQNKQRTTPNKNKRM